MPTGNHDFVVVANRLPVDITIEDDGSVSWQTSPGGLVTALEPVMKSSDGAWVGWSGTPDFAPAPFGANNMWLAPVDLAEEEIELYYEGFSNSTLWPLYHDVIAQPEYHREWWDAYVQVNARFAEKTAAETSENGIVWVHDYQLQLVPKMLREIRPDAQVGFFLHIPFPPPELFAQLPWRRQVLEGLLGADLLGFQRLSDASNFRQAVRRFTNLPTKGQMIKLNGRLSRDRNGTPDHRQVRATAFPISIDASGVDQLARTPEIQARAKEIRSELGNPEIMFLGVDRLDYTKGIRHRLKAYGELLADGEISVPQAALVQVASPSRERVESYQQLRDEVEVTVGRINGEYGELGQSAIHYMHHNYPREEMVAMYVAADIMLVTALRDGMNLVAKEYIAARHDARGVLVLSEFTGAADQLTQAMLVNPHDIDGMKATMMSAVAMSEREQSRRMRALRRRVMDNDVARWAQDFLNALQQMTTSTLDVVSRPQVDQGGHDA